MIENDSSVIAVGRRQDRLDDFVKTHGSKGSSSQFDISRISDIPKWAASIHESHPDLDFVLCNSGIQRGFDFSRPESVDLNLLEVELTTNYTSFIHLTMAFLPYLQERSKVSPTGIGFTTSGLAILPLVRCANYCASKAALHHWILVLRQQLKSGPGDVKCIEILPPAVQTELHDEEKQPDIKNGRSFGMPLEEFTEKAWAGLQEGKDQIPVGLSEPHFKEGGFEKTRQEYFHRMNGLPVAN